MVCCCRTREACRDADTAISSKVMPSQALSESVSAGTRENEVVRVWYVRFGMCDPGNETL